MFFLSLSLYIYILFIYLLEEVPGIVCVYYCANDTSSVFCSRQCPWSLSLIYMYTYITVKVNQKNSFYYHFITKSLIYQLRNRRHNHQMKLYKANSFIRWFCMVQLLNLLTTTKEFNVAKMLKFKNNKKYV